MGKRSGMKFRFPKNGDKKVKKEWNSPTLP